MAVRRDGGRWCFEVTYGDNRNRSDNVAKRSLSLRVLSSVRERIRRGVRFAHLTPADKSSETAFQLCDYVAYCSCESIRHAA